MNYSHEHAELVAKLFAGQKQEPVRRKFIELSDEFSVLNVAESLKLSRKYRCEIKNCYSNCLRIATRDSGYQYVEGYGMSVIPIEHAWLVNENGEVIDPTWVLTGEHFTTDYFGVRVPINKVELNGFAPGWLKYVLENIKG